MIRFADRDLWPQLQALWQRCFGDNADYTRLMFQGLLRPENILVHMGKRSSVLMDLEEGKLVESGEVPLAMLCFAPFSLAGPRQETKAAYVYGVATDPVARGQGLSTQLLSHLHGVLSRRGFAATVLVPASQSLFRFYGDRGYQTAFEVSAGVWQAGEIRPNQRPCVLTPSSLYRLKDLRDRLLGKDRLLYVSWDKDYLHFIGEECRHLGGEVLAITGNGREGFAVCYPVEDRIIVKELAVPPGRLEDVLAALHARYRAQEYHIRFPREAAVPGKTEALPFAMIKWYDKDMQEALAGEGAKGKPPYISHVLD